MKNIAIFGSGKGSNAVNIINHFQNHPSIHVAALASDKPRRGFLDISYEYRINLEIITGDELSDQAWIERFKDNYAPDLIILAGYIRLIPMPFIHAFHGRIINIHPALLPAYGGKGMYGMYVHEAVIRNQENKSGITIHYVNERYDEGEIIFQAECDIEPGDTAQTLANKIHHLEYKYFPTTIEKLLIQNHS
ncbi:MAG: phosphoribosylglycinamide formyltransferase [Flavobacteriales bacterium]